MVALVTVGAVTVDVTVNWLEKQEHAERTAAALGFRSAMQASDDVAARLALIVLVTVARFVLVEVTTRVEVIKLPQETLARHGARYGWTCGRSLSALTPWGSWL